LYPGEDAGGVPFKWMSSPFNNDWCSSIFTSLDPVAIESVGHDFLRTEYNRSTIPLSRPNWNGVDDYLHQAADSSLWPENVTYDPDKDGVLFASLGVHEHWNNSEDKQYTRNLENGDGIELYKIHETGTGISDLNQIKVSVYPNPADDYINISNFENEYLEFSLIDLNGKIFESGQVENQSIKKINLTDLKNGVYFICIKNSKKRHNIKIIRQMK